MPHPGPAPDAKPPLHGRHICDSCNQPFMGVPAYIDQDRVWACPLCVSQAEFEAAQADWLSTLRREWPTIQSRIAALEAKVERLEHPWTDTVNLPPHIHGQSCSPPPPPASRG